jgi:uncharacterized linocin/CFP29 family protein
MNPTLPLFTPVPGTAGVDVMTMGQNGTWQGHGSVAMRLMQNGFNLQGLRTNDVLRLREWIYLDNVVIEEARRRLTLVQDLIGAGLNFPVPNALGITRVEWQMATHMEGARVDMSALTPGREDRIEFSLVGLPLPIIHKEFRLDIRTLESSRRNGVPLDTTQVAQATRLVSETIEQMVVSGWPQMYGGMSIYGLTTAPYRNTGSLGGHWADAVYTGADIVADVQAMIALLQADLKYGPYRLYIPLVYLNKLNEDYKEFSDVTILQRLLQIPQIAGIEASEFLPANTVIMIQMTTDVMDLVNGFAPTLVQWQEHAGMEFHFKVMAIMIPRMKWDALLRSGVAHFSS